MKISRKRVKQVAWIAAALLTVPLWLIGYNVWYEYVAHRDYKRCMQLPSPADLATLEREFGRAIESRTLDDGTTETSFDPSPLYFRAWSDHIDVITRPPSTVVISVDCGEGW